MGRKTKLTPELIEVICREIRNGVPRKHAAAIAGIGESTLYEYVADNPDFAERVKKSDAEAISRNVGVVQVAAQNSWQASAWWLERRHSKDFGRKDNLHLGSAETNESAQEVVKSIVGIVHSRMPDVCPACQHQLGFRKMLAADLATIAKRFKPNEAADE